MTTDQILMGTSSAEILSRDGVEVIARLDVKRVHDRILHAMHKTLGDPGFNNTGLEIKLTTFNHPGEPTVETMCITDIGFDSLVGLVQALRPLHFTPSEE